MSGRRAIVGLCMLCALVFSAVAAQGASAATKGTTAFTCEKVTPAAGTAGFSKEHCKAGDAVGTNAVYEHKSIAENTTTELTGTNEKTGTNTNETSIGRLKATLNGVAFELSAEGVAAGPGPNWMENKKAASGEHYIHGEGKIHYTKVKVTKPAGSGCVVKGETVLTNQLTATTEGQGDALLFKPAGATPFASFTIEKCVAPFEGINGEHTVFGKVKTTSIDGATLTTTHANTTAQETLFIDNEFTPAGLAGELTLSGRTKLTAAQKKEEEEGKKVFPYTPLSSTTVETP